MSAQKNNKKDSSMRSKNIDEMFVSFLDTSCNFCLLFQQVYRIGYKLRTELLVTNRTKL